MGPQKRKKENNYFSEKTPLRICKVMISQQPDTLKSYARELRESVFKLRPLRDALVRVRFLTGTFSVRKQVSCPWIWLQIPATSASLIKDTFREK